MLPWWERWPGRLEDELNRLDRAGIAYELNDDAFRAGVVRLVVNLEVGDEHHRLVVDFPELYPDVRFEVYAPDLNLAHHQHPFAKNLCLLGRDSGNWLPSDTLATFLQERLPIVLQTGRSEDAAEVAGLEEEQAEPFTDYYIFQPSAMLLVDSSWVIDPTIPKGKLLIGIVSYGPSLRGAVLEVSDEYGVILARADEALVRRYASASKLRGRWIRSAAEIRKEHGKGFLAELNACDPRILTTMWQPVGKRQVDIVGVLFPEETAVRQTGDGWVFLERVRDRGNRSDSTLIRAGYAGRRDLAARSPELAMLGERRVAVFGLGALGMPSALALARAGVGELRVLDFDTVDPGTTSRWPFGLEAAGRLKTDVLKDFLAVEYPHTVVTPYAHRLGGLRFLPPDPSNLASARILPPEFSDSHVLESIFDGVDLVYDATAEEGFHPILDRLCRERGVPYIVVSGTNGAWGGTIVRTRPGTGCWHCFLAAQLDGTIPVPVEAPSGHVQPVGCASPTFTGAGVDLEAVAQMGVRLSLGTVVGARPDGYPDSDWDVGVGDFRSGEGQLIPPAWQTFALAPRPGCAICGGA